jgi:tRNA1(Val) A37 N6-methylase TrmN6
MQAELRKKELGAVYTPNPVAEFLSHWAIRSSSDKVLEPAAGRGVFVKAVVGRFRELGLSSDRALSQTVCYEKDEASWRSLRNQFGERESIIRDDFLLSSLPSHFDVVVGNPPYVERQMLTNYDKVRERPEFAALGSLTDTYGYFIVKAGSLLAPGGRLGFIVSDTWMNLDFGESIKAYLLEHFKIRAIVSFEKRVFPDVLVRAVLLLCEKKLSADEDSNRNGILFIGVKDTQDVATLQEIMETGKTDSARVVRKQQGELRVNEPWSAYLKASDGYFSLRSHPSIVPLSYLAETSIGLFSLANRFYIIDPRKKKQLGLENDYLDKIAVGPRHTPAVIESGDQLGMYVLYCKKSKAQLADTAVLRYIEKGESVKVSPVGKRFSVVGYNNLPRLQRARRTPWYNLVDEIDRRCRAPILFPRRIYGSFTVVWNKPLVVGGDNFICVTPRKVEYTEPLLAMLNSSLTEYFVRVRGQIYGGGVSDFRPDDVKNLPTMDLTKLSSEELARLTEAYRQFLASEDKRAIDGVVFAILNRRPEEIKSDLQDLRSLSQRTRMT